MNCDVILIVPPFAALIGPLLGPSVLLPQLRNRGISARVYYANMVLASYIGTTTYEHFTGMKTPGGGTIGEALFSHWARCGDSGINEVREEIDRMLDSRDRKGAFVGAKAAFPGVGQLRQEVSRCLDAIPEFLNRVGADILSYSPKIVGFTASYVHLAGAVALARHFKAAAPDLITVMGGPYAASPMGEAIARACGVMDFVFSGEADFAFPRFVEEFCARGELPGNMLIECAPVSDLDDVSVPDYNDYFEQMADMFVSERDREGMVDGMLFETSRGCWWGVKKRCTFCGLDARSGQTRRKSPDRVIEEMGVLSNRYGINKLVTADDAFPKVYLRTLLPKLAVANSRHPDLELNLRPDFPANALDIMQQAGVASLLCGIESFSTSVLRKLNKGVTAQQNLRLLRDCRSRNMPLTYGLLMGVPGEDPEAYRAMMNLIPKLEHLQAPRFLLSVKLLRWSAYFSDPEAYNITGIHPSPIYRLIFGDDADLEAIAYDFQATMPSELLSDDSLREEFSATVDLWCNTWHRIRPLPVLRKVEVTKGSLGIRDTRQCATQEFYVPDDDELALLDYLDSPRSRSDVSGEREERLENLLSRNFVADHEGFLLNLVTSPNSKSGTRRCNAAESNLPKEQVNA